MERNPDRRFTDFVEFLRELVTELNYLSKEGGIVLVEGKRDAAAIRKVGYDGPFLSISTIKKHDSREKLATHRRVVILTDLDREGGSLATKYSKILKHDGHLISLTERKRLLRASRGVFRHIENLKRFGHLVDAYET
ncbi:MAG: toprim domain-containing protein [Thaumarchaeota archaeon]|nr:toprim domain-containing protein [Nitrososphaerota archaeon]